MIARFLTCKTGWVEVSFNKIGKIEANGVSSRNSTFSGDYNESEVLLTYSSTQQAVGKMGLSSEKGSELGKDLEVIIISVVNQ